MSPPSSRTSSGLRSTGAPVVHQTWPIADGMIVFEIRSGRPLPASAYATVGDVVTSLERLAATLAPALGDLEPPAQIADSRTMPSDRASPGGFTSSSVMRGTILTARCPRWHSWTACLRRWRQRSTPFSTPSRRLRLHRSRAAEAEAIRDEMAGYYEVRVQGGGQNHRLFASLSARPTTWSVRASSALPVSRSHGAPPHTLATTGWSSSTGPSSPSGGRCSSSPGLGRARLRPKVEFEGTSESHQCAQRRIGLLCREQPPDRLRLDTGAPR